MLSMMDSRSPLIFKRLHGFTEMKGNRMCSAARPNIHLCLSLTFFYVIKRQQGRISKSVM